MLLQTTPLSFSTQRQLHSTIYMMFDNLKCIFCAGFPVQSAAKQVFVASRIILSMKGKKKMVKYTDHWNCQSNRLYLFKVSKYSLERLILKHDASGPESSVNPQVFISLPLTTSIWTEHTIQTRIRFASQVVAVKFWSTSNVSGHSCNGNSAYIMAVSNIL